MSDAQRLQKLQQLLQLGVITQQEYNARAGGAPAAPSPAVGKGKGKGRGKGSFTNDPVAAYPPALPAKGTGKGKGVGAPMDGKGKSAKGMGKGLVDPMSGMPMGRGAGKDLSGGKGGYGGRGNQQSSKPPLDAETERQLAKLQSLLAAGILTTQEFNTRKSLIMNKGNNKRSTVGTPANVGRILNGLEEGSKHSSGPVVTGPENDPSYLLQKFCDCHRLQVPDLKTHGIGATGKKTGSMEMSVDSIPYFVYVEHDDVRREGCVQLLHQIYPECKSMAQIKGKVNALAASMQGQDKRGNQKKGAASKEAAPKQVSTVSPESQAMTILNDYCQILRIPTPVVNADHTFKITLPGGKTHKLMADTTLPVKQQRTEASLRLLDLIFPEWDLEAIKKEVARMLTAHRAEQHAKDQAQHKAAREAKANKASAEATPTPPA